MVGRNTRARSSTIGTVLVLVAVVGVTPGGQAAAPSDDEIYAGCVAAEVTNFAWQACGAAYLGRLDTRLSAQWATVLHAAPETVRPDLATEQTAWAAYLAASCPLHAGGYFGREGEVLGLTACRAAVITNRLAALKQLASELAGH